MDIPAYINEIRKLHASGQSTEHIFRPALAKLFASIDPALTVINEPKHITDVGAPDFVFQRGGSGRIGPVALHHEKVMLHGIDAANSKRQTEEE